MWKRFRRGYALSSLALVLCAATAIVTSAGNKPKVPPSKPIDVNAASSEELQQLPGIGPVIAQRIVDYRKKSGPFRRVEELMAVRGISEKRLAKIRPYVFVKGATPAPQKPEPHSQ
jgi:comEA protein